VGATIRISIRELEVIAQKVLEGAGVPSGLDHDGAHAVVWCEARGLKGIEALLCDPRALSGFPERRATDIDAIGLSALCVAPLAIDLSMSTGKRLIVHNIKSPFVAIAYAVRKTCDDRWFELMWGSSRALVVKGKASMFRTKRSFSNILTIVSGRSVPSSILNPSVPASELEERYHCALNEGLVVKKSILETLVAMANQVLVPTSDQSRSSAGAEVDDNQ